MFKLNCLKIRCSLDNLVDYTLELCALFFCYGLSDGCDTGAHQHNPLQVQHETLVVSLNQLAYYYVCSIDKKVFRYIRSPESTGLILYMALCLALNCNILKSYFMS